MDDFADWPDCAIEGCQRKCCLALDSIYCFPHTPGNPHVNGMKIDIRNPEPIEEDEPADALEGDE